MFEKCIAFLQLKNINKLSNPMVIMINVDVMSKGGCIILLEEPDSPISFLNVSTINAKVTNKANVIPWNKVQRVKNIIHPFYKSG